MFLKKRKLNIFLFVFIFLILNILYFFVIEYPQKVKINKNNDFCLIHQEIKIVNGTSMDPLIKNTEEVLFLKNYYNCHNVQRGDVVAYNYKKNDNPLIKKVRVIGGDDLKIKGDNLWVNGEILKNSQGKIYFFDNQNKKMLELYITDQGKMVDDAFFIFGENTERCLDSRKFGAVGKNGFLGKFMID